MSLHLHHNQHINNFLQNKEMNEVYLSYGISNFALGLIYIFVPVYLYKLGYSIPAVMFYFLLLNIGFVSFSYIGAKIVAKLGVKHSMLIATPILIAYLLGLRVIVDYPWLYYILPLVLAFKSVLYNYSFHLNFVQHSDRQTRGKQVSLLQAAALAGSLLSPIAGGFLIKFFGFPMLFIVGSVILMFSVIPLFFTADTYEKISFNKTSLIKDIFKKENLPLTLSYSGYAIEDWIGFVLWPIFLAAIAFSTESIGEIVSISATLTFLIFYLIGKATDEQDRKKLIKIGTVLYFFGWLGRLFVNSFFSVLFIDTYKKITGQILQIPWSAYSYDLAAKSNYFRFIVAREIIFDLSRAVVIPFVILPFYFNFHPFGLAFLVAALASLFYAALSKMEIGSEKLPSE